MAPRRKTLWLVILFYMVQLRERFISLGLLENGLRSEIAGLLRLLKELEIIVASI